jgi:hypothetical protein
MHQFNVVDLVGVLAISWVMVRILGPVGRALAKKIEGSPPAVVDDGTLADLQGQMDQLQERVDFLERALAAQKSPQALPKRDQGV